MSAATSHKNLREVPVKLVSGKVNLSDIQDSNEREIYIRGYDAANKGPAIGTRHVQVFLMFLCLTIGIAMRFSLSVAIVAMTDENASSNPNVPTYQWNNKSVILSSFIWGYVALQVLAGYLGSTYGPKYFLLSAFVINSVAFLLIPFAANILGSFGVMLCRVVQGLAQGFIFPSAHNILGKWAPIEERSTMGMIVYSGLNIGPILSYIITGYLSSSWVGWPASFYLFGALGLGWCILFYFLAHNSPASHPSISKEELRYIEASLEQKSGEDEESIPVPWLSILTSLPVFAVLVANVGASWGFTMGMTEIPTYLAKVLKLEIASTGLASSVPYICSAITGAIVAPLSDYLVSKDYISRVNARRIFHVTALYGSLVCILLLAYVAKSQTTSVILIAAGNAFHAGTLAGYSINHMDLSPRFAGILQGICNGTSQLFALFSPLLVQFVVRDEKDASQWRLVFLVAAVIYFVSATFFALCVSATRQDWDGPINRVEEKTDRLKKQSIISVTGY